MNLAEMWCSHGAICHSPGTNEAGQGNSNTEPRQSLAKISPTGIQLLVEAHQPQYSTPAHSAQVVITLHSGTAADKSQPVNTFYYSIGEV
jgi:hypothetical protein